MNVFAFALVLIAAALHAMWNAVVKAAKDKHAATTLVAGGAAALAVILLPLVPPPAPASWPLIITSGVLQIVYYPLIAKTYRQSDMSLAYPLMRGTAPLLVALSSAFLIAEAISWIAWVGIAAICFGIATMAADAHAHSKKGLYLVFVNALVIAAYTIIDGIGVRRSGAPLAYTLWIFLLSGAPFVLHAFLTRKKALLDFTSRQWPIAIIGGGGTVVSYGLALWAMTKAPIAVVAALRETAILFGMVISAWLLHEQVRRTRLVAAGLIATGAILLRIS